MRLKTRIFVGLFVTPSLAALVILSAPSLHRAASDSLSGAGYAPKSWISFRSGRLVYGQDARGNRIPDFSYAGYEDGGVPLPNVPAVQTLKPDGAADDTARIQQAIDEVAAKPADSHGIRGAVLLAPGNYNIGGTLTINASGIVLRGSGSQDGGTLLVAVGSPRALLRISGTGRIESGGDSHPITDDYVPIGANSFHVASTQGLAVGDSVIVERPQETNWIHVLGMDHIPPRPNGTPSRPWRSNPGLLFERKITALNGNTITIDIPLTNALESQYTHAGIWKYTFPGRISRSGVEDLSADGAAFVNDPSYHRTGYFRSQLLNIDRISDGWARNLVARHFSSAFNVGSGALRVSILHTAVLDASVPLEITAQPVAYVISGQQTLIDDNYVTGTNIHSWATQALVAGPNVFTHGATHNTGEKKFDAGPHQRWASGTLYDSLTMDDHGDLALHDRAWMGSGQGWAGADSVLWNCRVGTYQADNPPTAYNWAIGCVGRLVAAPGYAPGEIVSPGRPVQPASLYDEQLKERKL